MPNKKHHIKLTPEERKEHGAVARKRNAAAARVQRAKVILAVDIGPGGPGLTDLEASLGSGWTTRSIQRLRARACEVGPLGALERKPRDQPPVAAKVTGEVEAAMVKVACSDAPEGHSSWTMSLIAGRLVELGLVESISGETVRTTLKKTISSRGSRSAGASRPKRTRPL